MEDDDIPKWANFICPSCAVAYGVNALIKAIKKRRHRIDEQESIIDNI
ncbi:MAG: hypothetical protein HY223_03090 [Thaumarchaeota archaeon]|nr:hypothetical protein [Nitrososphaerota archaeon]